MRSPIGRSASAGVVVVLLALLLSAGGVVGATDVTAQPTFVDTDVTGDTVWTPEEGPYRVTTDIAVTEGATLSVEPGTTVEFVDGASLVVRGRLDAADTGERVVLESFREDENASAAAWAGLVVSGEATLNDARVADAMTGLRTEPGGSLSATDLAIDRMRDGVVIGAGSQVTLRNASFDSIGRRDVRLGTRGDERAAEAGGRATELEVRSSTLPNGMEGAIDGDGETTVIASGTDFDGPVDIEADALRLRDSTISTRFDIGAGEYLEEVRSVSLVDSTVTADGVLVAEASDRLRGTVESSRISGRVRLVEPAGLTVRENEIDGGRVVLGGYSVIDATVAENRITNGSISLATSNSVEGSTIEDNRAYGGGTPLLVEAKFVSSTRVAGNGVYGAEGTGIALRAPRTGEAGGLTLRDNTVVGSGTGIRIEFSGGGSLYDPGRNSTVRGNLIAANEQGLVVYKDLTTRITDNRIVDNEVGVRLDSLGTNEDQIYAVDRNDLRGNQVALAYLGPSELTVSAEENYWGAENGPDYPAVVPNGDGAGITTDGPTVDVIPFARAPPESLPAALPTPSVTVETGADGTVTVAPSGIDGATGYVVSFGDGTWTTLRADAAEHTYRGSANHTVTVYAIGADGRASVPPARESVVVTTPTSTPTPGTTDESEDGPTATGSATAEPTGHTPAQGLDGFGIAVAVFTLLAGGLVARRN